MKISATIITFNEQANIARAIESLEKDARGWYGGAVGLISLDGGMNTGITIRTIHVREGVARYAAGATLLYDSIPANEDAECRLKATGFFRALRPEEPTQAADKNRSAAPQTAAPSGIRLLLVDNEDCFIHTLANYARQTGAQVMTYRTGIPLELIQQLSPSLLLVSPGPGRPAARDGPTHGGPGCVRRERRLFTARTAIATPRPRLARRPACTWLPSSPSDPGQHRQR